MRLQQIAQRLDFCRAIAERLNLLQPIYANTAAYGHFGRLEFPWEQPDRVAQLQEAVK